MDSAASGMSALLLLTHTLTHNRKSASGFSGLFSKPNRHFLSHAAPIGLGITLFFLQSDFGTKRPCVQVTSLRPCLNPHEHYVCAGYLFTWKCRRIVFWSLFGRYCYQKRPKDTASLHLGYCVVIILFSVSDMSGCTRLNP